MDKSIVILTNFWDADSLINNNQLLVNQEDKIYRINLDSKEKNYKVFSIALSHPDFSDKDNLKDMSRIDCLCPTYSLLKRYKDNKDWAAYEKDFVNLIKNRKEDVKEWALSLKPDFVYFLCCWENTSHGAHCHRDILYKGFKSSKVITNIIPIYRSGEFKKAKQNNKEGWVANNATFYDPTPTIFNSNVATLNPSYNIANNPYNINYNINSGRIDAADDAVDALSYVNSIYPLIGVEVTDQPLHVTPNGILPIIDESVDNRTDFDDSDF